MRSGAAGTDAYLSEWRKVPEGEGEGDDAEAARLRAAALDEEWPESRLRAAAMAGAEELWGKAPESERFQVAG